MTTTKTAAKTVIEENEILRSLLSGVLRACDAQTNCPSCHRVASYVDDHHEHCRIRWAIAFLEDGTLPGDARNVPPAEAL
jgi:hypothetical protein